MYICTEFSEEFTEFVILYVYRIFKQSRYDSKYL